MPNHANCYCSRADFANQVKICVTSNAALKCTAAADINMTKVWVDGYCGDSRTGSGGNGGGTRNGTGQVSVSSLSGSILTLTASSTTSGTAAPASTPISPTLTPSSILSTSAKAGIAIGIVVVVTIVATVAFFLFRSWQRNGPKTASPVYEVGDEQRVHEADGITNPSEMDSKDAALVPVPIYELPSPGGGGESELEGTQMGSTLAQQVSSSSPLGRDEAVNRNGTSGAGTDARGRLLRGLGGTT